MTETPYTVDATETSLSILETLVDHGDPMGVTALADEVGVAKSVVHNHLSTLRARGYVYKEESRYRPSLRTLNLGVRTRSAITVCTAAKEELDNLATATGETTSLFVLEETAGVPVYVAEPDDGWTPAFREGERLPLHVNAPGKSILASLPNDRVAEILDATDLVAPTEATTTNPEDLDREIRKIRDDRIAFCRGEQYEGIVGVAAPIETGAENRVAALGVCGSVRRLNGRYLEEDITGQVLSTAKSIQVNLTSSRP